MAAVEFALVAPLFLLLIVGLVDLGIAYHAKLRVNAAISAASYYAFQKGQGLTAATAPAYKTSVEGVASSLLAGVSDDLSVEVLINNDPTGAKASTTFCVSGYPPVFTAAGTTSTSCGGNLMSGKFVRIAVSGHIKPIFVSANLLGGYLVVADFALVRIE
ncbi:pilus assembly protein [Rhizobium sp. DKSPLA3]|uniref:Pilus assembly protein n=1 Tax=Rhizobium quercicola TaxID=2901226 RepID=A0A9X1T2Z7_9HYPH|nr:pilus assembly protein [Rhizobium quercicola]